MKILLTGATGFLGSHIAKALLVEGYELAILKRTTSQMTRLSSIEEDRYISFDVDTTPLDTIFSRYTPDIIIHTAASYGKNEPWSSIIESNLNFPLKLIEAAIRYGVKTFINTDTSLPASINTYALAKKQFVDWLTLSQSNLQVINFVTQYFYGSGDESWKFISMLIGKMLKNEAIDLSEGLPKRDFIYIDDVVNAYLTVLKQREKLSSFESLSLGSGEAIMLRELVLLCKTLTKSSSELNFGKIPTRNNEIMFAQANTQALFSMGWKPQVSLEEGLLKVISGERE
jgi:CDP-paratose synthetase